MAVRVCNVSRFPLADLAKGGSFGDAKAPPPVAMDSAVSGVTTVDAEHGPSLRSKGVMTRGQKRKAETTVPEEPSRQKSKPLSIPTPSSCQWSSQTEPGSTKVRLTWGKAINELYPPYGATMEVSGSTCSSAVVVESSCGPASVSQRSSHSSRRAQRSSAPVLLESVSAGVSQGAHSGSNEDEDCQFLRSEEEDVEHLLADESQLDDGSTDQRSSETTYYDAPEPSREQEAGTSTNQDWEEAEQCGEYEEAIFSHLKQREKRHRPLGRYLVRRETDITAGHRAIMINWLVEFVAEFNLQMETLFLSVAIMDKFLSEGPLLKKSHLQLLGSASLLCAVKLEETEPPRMVNELSEVANFAFSRDQIIGMEKTILSSLKFTLYIPTPYNFIWRHLRFTNEPTQAKDNLAEYLIGLALLDHDMLQFPASQVAASAVFLASYSFSTRPDDLRRQQFLDLIWPAALANESGYSRSDLSPCVEALNQLHKDVYSYKRFPKLTALRERYQNDKDGVALTVPDDLPTWLLSVA